MNDQSDSNARITTIENSMIRVERAIENLVEAQHETSRVIAQSLVYQQQHDKNTERTGKRLESIENDVREKFSSNSRKIDRIITIATIAGVILSFLSGYAVDGLLKLNSTYHNFDKRMDRFDDHLEHDKKNTLFDVSILPEDKEKPKPPKPQPKTILTDKL